MDCPKCGNSNIRTVAVNGLEKSRIVRRRQCRICDHIFCTVELEVPKALVKWARMDDWGQCKPTLTVPAWLQLGQES